MKSEHEPLVRCNASPKKVETKPIARPGFTDVVEAVLSFPKEVWLMYAIKYLESYSYFILAYSLVLFLSTEFGFGDEQAGWAYGLFGMLVTIYGFGIGVVIDYFGLRNSLLLGLTTLIISRLVLACTNSLTVLTACLGIGMPVGLAMTLPLLQIGIRRYTTDENRSVAFSGFYIVMNLSAMTAAPCIDAFHRMMPNFKQELLGIPLTPYRLLILAGALVSCVSLLISFVYIKEDQVMQSSSLADTFRQVFRSNAFWRFLLLAVLLLGVRSIYRHLDATFPKYMVRNFGKDAPYGSLIALNPFCVVIVTLLATPLAMMYPPVPVIIFGSFISSISPFVLALGHSYSNAIVFVLLLSIGEGIWSPRLYEYSVLIAEKGREGTFMALAGAPMFLATLLTGATSGALLDRYSPEKGERQPEIMWAIIGLTSFLSPVLMLLLRGVIEGSI